MEQDTDVKLMLTWRENDLKYPAGFMLSDRLRCCIRHFQDAPVSIYALFSQIKMDEKFRNERIHTVDIGKNIYKVLTDMKENAGDVPHYIVYELLNNNMALCLYMSPRPAHCGDDCAIKSLKYDEL